MSNLNGPVPVVLTVGDIAIAIVVGISWTAVRVRWWLVVIAVEVVAMGMSVRMEMVRIVIDHMPLVQWRARVLILSDVRD